MKKEYVAPEYRTLQYVFSDTVATDGEMGDNDVDGSSLFPAI